MDSRGVGQAQGAEATGQVEVKGGEKAAQGPAKEDQHVCAQNHQDSGRLFFPPLFLMPANPKVLSFPNVYKSVFESF